MRTEELTKILELDTQAEILDKLEYLLQDVYDEGYDEGYNVGFSDGEFSAS